MELLTAKTELKEGYGVVLNIEDKLKVLEVLKTEIYKELSLNTSHWRIPLLAKMSVIEEYSEILEAVKKYELLGEQK